MITTNTTQFTDTFTDPAGSVDRADRFEVFGDAATIDMADRFGDATIIDLADRFDDAGAEPRDRNREFLALLTPSAVTMPAADLAPAFNQPSFTASDLQAIDEFCRRIYEIYEVDTGVAPDNTSNTPNAAPPAVPLEQRRHHQQPRVLRGTGLVDEPAAADRERVA